MKHCTLMKYILLIGDGMGDTPVPELGAKPRWKSPINLSLIDSAQLPSPCWCVLCQRATLRAVMWLTSPCSAMSRINITPVGHP